MPPYKNPQEALAGTTTLAQPTNDAQRQAIAQASALVPITPSALNPTQPITPVTTPPVSVPDTNSLLSLISQPTETEQKFDQGSDLLTSLTASLGGEEGRRLELEQSQGVAEKTQATRELESQLKQIVTESQAAQLQYRNTLDQNRAMGGSSFQLGANEQATARAFNQQELTRAIKAYSVGAQLQAAQGNLSTALELVDRAVKAEFDPIRARIEARRENLDRLLKSPTLTREQEDRAFKRKQVLDREQRLFENAEQDKRTIQQMSMEAASFGAPSDVIRRATSSNSVEEAIAILGPNLRDPAQQAKLETMRLDNILTKERIATERRQRELLGQPTQAEIKAEKEALKKAQEEGRQAEAQLPFLEGKISLIDTVLENPALESVVGTSFLSRGPAGILGTIGGVASLVGIPSVVGGTMDKITGKRQDLISGVEQLVQKEFLDNLISVKAQGGTFGALTKAEQDALTQAASKIGTWRITDKEGNVLGYNASEKSFKEEIKRIQSLARTAYQKATGKVLTNDETELLDQIYSTSPAVLSGDSFYR